MIISLLKLARLYYSLPLACGIVVILSYLTANNLGGIVDKTIFAVSGLFCVIAGGYVLNDVCDIETDRINNPEKTLPAGKVRARTAVIFAGVLFAVGLVFAALCTGKFFAGVLVIVLALIFYDLYSKRLGVFKNVVVALLTISLYPLAFTITAPTESARLSVLFIHPVWFFLTTIAYQMLKDITDAEGDEAVSKGQISYRRKKSFLTAARCLTVLAGLILLVPSILGCCKEIYLGAAIMGVMLAVVSAGQRPRKAIFFIYAQVLVITLGSFVDLMVLGP
jgi:geranylgeranylglycerol-phosphate geranylgeranyltransferase